MHISIYIYTQHADHKKCMGRVVMAIPWQSHAPIGQPAVPSMELPSLNFDGDSRGIV